MGMKLPGREGDLSLISTAEVKNGWIYSWVPVYAVTACIGKIQITRFYSPTGHLLPHFASTALRSLVSRFGSYFRYHLKTYVFPTQCTYDYWNTLWLFPTQPRHKINTENAVKRTTIITIMGVGWRGKQIILLEGSQEAILRSSVTGGA
jgi:hypothetical protein